MYDRDGSVGSTGGTYADLCLVDASEKPASACSCIAFYAKMEILKLPLNDRWSFPGKYKLWGKTYAGKMDQWINWVEYDELLAGHHNAPHNLLGLHEFGKGQVFTVYRPEAQKITVTDKNGKHALELEEIQEGSGFFGKYVPDHKYKKPYLYIFNMEKMIL